ncbi:MAG: hypothetical protein L6R40_001476 [Gallowayella cf. fulva]|nr:MAG: hypothetical protein L6R40_001476 [Xanthomendoza cf. fulva]
MPGVLKDERDDGPDSTPSQAFPIKSPLMADHKPGKRTVENDQHGGSPLVNGARGGASANQTSGDPTAFKTSALENPSTQLPPEIMHITQGYLPLSELITRLVQETFNGMSAVINDMSQLQMPQVNGSAPANPPPVNVQKKLSLLEFAQDRRAKFIKILVLSQWSRQAESISRVIDLKVWLNTQNRQYDEACSWMGALKRMMALERMPNPDLKTALEALSLGKVLGLPDLGYLPPEHVSPDQLLNALRSINTQLTIRLRLHETIPPFFKSYSIRNGRATFRVSNEFEVDLSIADEDLSSQLYFVDFRFTFSPSPAELPQGRLRDDLEARVNDLLRKDGLHGCYRFLHDFVLSHKLNIFRHQAHRMLQGSWSEHLKLEAVHRSLVMQYWVTRPGGKNWIELGIRRRKLKKSSWLHKEEDEPHIGIRWFRAGKEVTDVPATINLGDLSVEAIVKQIISAHTNSIFREVGAGLREGHLYRENLLRLKHIRSNSEPLSSRLSVQFTTSQSCTIIQEPVSGRLVLLPPSLLYNRAEREINGLVSPEKAASACVAHLRAAASCDEVEHALRCYGWEVFTAMRLNQEGLKRHFGRDALSASFFKKRSWDARWLLAFTASLEGDSWWIMKLGNRGSLMDSNAALGSSVGAAIKLPSATSSIVRRELSFLELSRIEHTAAGLISQYADSKQLALQKIPHRLVKTRCDRPFSELPTLYVHLPKHPAQPSAGNPKTAKMPCFSQVVRVTFMGINKLDSYANHLVVAETDCATLRSRRLDARDGGSVIFHPTSGAFALPLRTPVGQSAIPSLLGRLSGVQRLINYVTTLQSFKIQDLSLNHFELTYATEPQDLRVKFDLDECPPRLSFRHGNPHLRIQKQLTTLLGKDDGLKHAMLLLPMTLPLMRALVAIEGAHVDNEVYISPRSAEWYQIQYQRPLYRFDMRLRRRREKFMWFVQEASLPDGKKPDARAHEQFRRMTNGQGEGWNGISPGIVASVEGVEGLLKKIDDIFQHGPTAEPAPIDEVQDYKAQKRKREDDEVVVLD